MFEEILARLTDCPVHGGMCPNNEAAEMSHKRYQVVTGISRDSNEKGLDFQPGQVFGWSGTPKTPRRRRSKV